MAERGVEEIRAAVAALLARLSADLQDIRGLRITRAATKAERDGIMDRETILAALIFELLPLLDTAH